MPNHNTSRTVLQMIAAKLPQVNTADSAISEAMSVLTFDIMTELEKCFKVRYRSIVDGKIVYNEAIPENEEESNIGNEAYYTNAEKSIISDMVCMQYIFSDAIERSSEITNTTAPKYVKKAKAGSAEVEYDKADAKILPFLIDAEMMMGKFKSDAQRKALKLGCVIDICDDCTYKAYLNNPSSFAINNFLIVRSGCV